MQDILDQINQNDIIHVLPINDTHKHEEVSYKCLCNPKLMLENDHLIVVHNSWDGRELHEQNRPIN